MPSLTCVAIRRALAAFRHVPVAILLLGAPQAGAVQMQSGASSSVNLEAGKGTLVRLDRPANAVFVADPEICDVQLTSPRLVYLLAKEAGGDQRLRGGRGRERAGQRGGLGRP